MQRRTACFQRHRLSHSRPTTVRGTLAARLEELLMTARSQIPIWMLPDSSSTKEDFLTVKGIEKAGYALPLLLFKLLPRLLSVLASGLPLREISSVPVFRTP